MPSEGLFALEPSPSIAMPAGIPDAPQPAGFVSFCLRHADQCAPSEQTDAPKLDPALWALLSRINEEVNASIALRDDREHYGRPEYWTIPDDGYGDCEDYALTKRKRLIDAGLPMRALRIAIIATPARTAHAVLTVTTDRGDYVLDNLTGNIRPWTETDYVWMERQDPDNSWGWVSFDAPSETQGSASARAQALAYRMQTQRVPSEPLITQ